MLNEFPEGVELSLKVGRLILQQAVLVVDMILALPDLLFELGVLIIEVKTVLFEPLLQSFNFLLIPIPLRIKHLPDGGFLLDELLYFLVLLLDCSLALGQLVLKALDVLEVVGLDLAELGLVHLAQLYFEGVFLALEQPFVLDQLAPDVVVLPPQGGDGLFEVGLLFGQLRTYLLVLLVPLGEQLLQLDVLSLEVVQRHEVALLDGLYLL